MVTRGCCVLTISLRRAITWMHTTNSERFYETEFESIRFSLAFQYSRTTSKLYLSLQIAVEIATTSEQAGGKSSHDLPELKEKHARMLHIQNQIPEAVDHNADSTIDIPSLLRGRARPIIAAHCIRYTALCHSLLPRNPRTAWNTVTPSLLLLF